MAYENYAVQLAIALGADEATAMQDIKEIIDFEIQIANVIIFLFLCSDIIGIVYTYLLEFFISV